MKVERHEQASHLQHDALMVLVPSTEAKVSGPEVLPSDVLAFACADR